jgi:hypothetical protein
LPQIFLNEKLLPASFSTPWRKHRSWVELQL